MDKLHYWIEAVECSFDEHGIAASKEQIAAVAADMEGARDCEDMAFHVPENPLIGETKRLTAALKAEREKVLCKECTPPGSGQIVTHGPVHSGWSQCWKCGGEGRHAP